MILGARLGFVVTRGVLALTQCEPNSEAELVLGMIPRLLGFLGGTYSHLVFFTGCCPRWAVPDGSTQHSIPPGTYVTAELSARHSESIKYVIRKPLIIFFCYSNSIIDHYLGKFSATMRLQLPTGYSVKYDIHSKPEQIA